SIVCACRSVAEAEVHSALAAPPVPTTVDGVKRRCGVGFGDCQGNMCQAEVVESLAAARTLPVEAILRGAPGSWIVATASAAATTRPGPSVGVRAIGRLGPADGAEVVDLVVVGGGLAGIGSALAAADTGLRVAVLDRGTEPGGGLADLLDRVATDDERRALGALRAAVADGRIAWRAAATVSDAVRVAGDGWEVQVQLASGAETVLGRRLILATGGYIMPREHLAIDGPRPSGVMTADFALAALRRGWLPTRRAVIVGSGRLAAGLEGRLIDAGGEVIARLDAGSGAHDQTGRRPFPVREVRGNGRLEAVLVGDRWLDADGLILAHAVRPATFLLRGLGIGDERPGVPAPVGPDGDLPLPDLWAVGTCAVPDVDRGRSLAAGIALGSRIATLASIVGTEDRP
ncbi:MAG: FAD-dependent oxidoreductase, partial [Chloroflexi bacterium]|nr:FAD-dependent oxidoreductase [Chloroflexota bacterium]